MGRTTSVTIGDPLNDFIEKLIQKGCYGSTSEVMRSGESNFSLKDIAKMRKEKLNV